MARAKSSAIQPLTCVFWESSFFVLRSPLCKGRGLRWGQILSPSRGWNLTPPKPPAMLGVARSEIHFEAGAGAPRAWDGLTTKNSRSNNQAAPASAETMSPHSPELHPP